MEPTDAIFMSTADEFDDWLTSQGDTKREIWISIFNKSSKKQTVTFLELLDVAICQGWIDVKTKSLDEERYAIRFVPRKPGSNWSPTNRDRASKLVEAGQMKPRGQALLPDDLQEIGNRK